MANIKEGDYVFRSSSRFPIFAKVQKIESTDNLIDEYTIVGPEGEFRIFAPELLTKKLAKEWIVKLEQNIKFLKSI